MRNQSGIAASLDTAVISANLRELLTRPEYKTFTKRGIANRLEVSPTTVGQHLRGAVRPTSRLLAAWALFLKVKMDQIIARRSAGPDLGDWREILSQLIRCEDVRQFQSYLFDNALDSSSQAMFARVRKAIIEAQRMGHVDFGWSEDHVRAAQICRAFKLPDPVQVQVVEAAAKEGSSHIFDAAAEAIWSHAMRLFEIRSANGGSKDDLVVIKGAIGSGWTVAEVMERVIERIARLCRSPGGPPLLPLTFDFHPMASSIHTQRPADNIPSVFLHSAIDRRGLVHLKERVYPTPDQMYRIKNSNSWFFRNIDFVVTSIASRRDKDSMLNQHLSQLRFPQQEWIGEVQFRPFSSEGFVSPTDQRLPKTLIPIQKLQEFSMFRPKGRPQPLVIMVAGPCGVCGRKKDDALRPMLLNPLLRVFNHLVIDSETARALLSKRVNRGERTKG